MRSFACAEDICRCRSSQRQLLSSDLIVQAAHLRNPRNDFVEPSMPLLMPSPMVGLMI
jgi:hypothetical protein